MKLSVFSTLFSMVLYCYCLFFHLPFKFTTSFSAIVVTMAPPRPSVSWVSFESLSFETNHILSGDLVRALIAVMKHYHQNRVRELRVYSTYTSTSLFIIRRSWDRNSSRAGVWRQKLMQTLEMLLPGLLLRLVLPTLYRPQDHQSKGVPTYNGWALLHQSLRKCSAGLPTTRSPGDMFSIQASSCPMTLAWIKLT